MPNSYPASEGRNGMGRLRVWTDESTESGIRWLRAHRSQSTSRLVGTAIALYWFAAAEKAAGNRVVSLAPDGTTRDIL